MPVKTEKELGEQLRSLWLKAVAAIELRNFGYAISLLQGILKQEPEFLTGRQLLRRAEVTKHKADKRAFFNISTSAISIMKAQRELKKDPRRAVEMIEKVLEDEPYNRQANLVLKQAALAAGWPEIGVFALQTLLEGESARHQNSPRIGPALSRVGRKRQRGRDLQPDHRDRPARRRSGPARQRCISPPLSDEAAVGPWVAKVFLKVSEALPSQRAGPVLVFSEATVANLKAHLQHERFLAATEDPSTGQIQLRIDSGDLQPQRSWMSQALHVATQGDRVESAVFQGRRNRQTLLSSGGWRQRRWWSGRSQNRFEAERPLLPAAIRFGLPSSPRAQLARKPNLPRDACHLSCRKPE